MLYLFCLHRGRAIPSYARSSEYLGEHRLWALKPNLLSPHPQASVLGFQLPLISCVTRAPSLLPSCAQNEEKEQEIAGIFVDTWDSQRTDFSPLLI